jgi:hypothetical protein
MSSPITDRLRAGTMLGAEGYVFELERRGYIKAKDAAFLHSWTA